MLFNYILFAAVIKLIKSKFFVLQDSNSLFIKHLHKVSRPLRQQPTTYEKKAT